MTKPIPDGFHAVTPYFIFKNAQKAIAFYQKAFSATQLDMHKDPTGQKVMHATIKVGDSILMMADEMPEWQSAESLGASPVSSYIYTTDADKLFNQAVAAGATVDMPIMDMFWGDRCGTIKDPFGYTWMIATHKQDLTEEQLNKGAEAFYAQMAQQKA